ncbi:cytochrome p 450 [Moniliophthora roreri]|nr:cytochrome p 450 [Moniliophthora roreri]
MPGCIRDESFMLPGAAFFLFCPIASSPRYHICLLILHSDMYYNGQQQIMVIWFSRAEKIELCASSRVYRHGTASKPVKASLSVPFARYYPGKYPRPKPGTSERPPYRAPDPLINHPTATVTSLPEDDLTFIHRPPPTAPSPLSFTTNPVSPLLQPQKPPTEAPLPPLLRPSATKEALSRVPDKVVAKIRQLRLSNPEKYTRGRLAKQFGVTQHFVALVAATKKSQRKQLVAEYGHGVPSSSLSDFVCTSQYNCLIPLLDEKLYLGRKHVHTESQGHPGPDIYIVTVRRPTLCPPPMRELMRRLVGFVSMNWRSDRLVMGLTETMVSSYSKNSIESGTLCEVCDEGLLRILMISFEGQTDRVSGLACTVSRTVGSSRPAKQRCSERKSITRGNRFWTVITDKCTAVLTAVPNDRNLSDADVPYFIKDVNPNATCLPFGSLIRMYSFQSLPVMMDLY